MINAGNVELSGQKWENKTYIRHTGYPGGQRTATAREVMEKNPISLVERAVKGMLPKNTLGRELYRTNLYVYAEGDHNHEAQKPKSIKLEDIK